jgi:hypothetical protein
VNRLRKLILLVCISALASCNARSPSPRLRHPNIIFILTDDQSMGELAYMPNTLKLLGERGATFDNFFVSISLCCPSRTSILRGQYGHNTRVVDNELPGGGFEKVFALGLEKSMIPVWLQVREISEPVSPAGQSCLHSPGLDGMV